MCFALEMYTEPSPFQNQDLSRLPRSFIPLCINPILYIFSRILSASYPANQDSLCRVHCFFYANVCSQKAKWTIFFLLYGLRLLSFIPNDLLGNADCSFSIWGWGFRQIHRYRPLTHFFKDDGCFTFLNRPLRVSFDLLRLCRTVNRKGVYCASRLPSRLPGTLCYPITICGPYLSILGPNGLWETSWQSSSPLVPTLKT